MTIQTCPRCGGSGLWGFCMMCTGTGLFGSTFKVTCGNCGGSGRGRCTQCNGIGKMDSQANANQVPPPPQYTQPPQPQFLPDGVWYSRLYDINKRQFIQNPEIRDIVYDIYEFSRAGYSSVTNMPEMDFNTNRLTGKTFPARRSGSWSYDPVSRTLTIGGEQGRGALVLTMVSQIEDSYLFKGNGQLGYYLFSRSLKV